MSSSDTHAAETPKDWQVFREELGKQWVWLGYRLRDAGPNVSFIREMSP